MRCSWFRVRSIKLVSFQRVTLCGRCSVRTNTSLTFAIPLAIALRQSLIDLASSHQAMEGQRTKMEIVYQYLTGPRFRHRIEAIIEKFTDMQVDLDRERKTMMRMWAKREEQLKGVLDSTAGLYGDLQGIAGRAMQEIESLDVLMIEDGAASKTGSS